MFVTASSHGDWENAANSSPRVISATLRMLCMNYYILRRFVIFFRIIKTSFSMTHFMRIIFILLYAINFDSIQLERNISRVSTVVLFPYRILYRPSITLPTYILFLIIKMIFIFYCNRWLFEQ